ncbi:hypothetical protein V4R08_00510 [Nitrobacter sp. NHB1]|uniref:hypothetical protein n=1 Tax=Nitrobacter sp. NHB1 TaxID=3119830 RepID=UPI002FFE0B00
MGLKLNEILRGTGISEASLDRVRIGSGVVGRTSAVAFVAMVGFAVIGYSLRDPLYLIALALIMAGVFSSYFIGIIRVRTH